MTERLKRSMLWARMERAFVFPVPPSAISTVPAMEFFALLMVAAAAVLVYSQFHRLPDNREGYARDLTGRSIALLCAGPGRGDGRFDTPNHERIIHDRTPHQNPAVIERYSWLPFGIHMQYRYYPLTVSTLGYVPDLAAIQSRIMRTKLRRHQILSLVTMDECIERQAAIRENEEQLARGVIASALTYDRKGRRR